MIKVNDKISSDAGYNSDIYISQDVEKMVIKSTKNEKYLNDYEGVLYDICYMSKFTYQLKPGASEVFSVRISRLGRKKTFYFTILKNDKKIHIDTFKG